MRFIIQVRRLDAALSSDPLNDLDKPGSRQSPAAEDLAAKNAKNAKKLIGVTLAAEASKNLRTRKAPPSRWFADVSSAEASLPRTRSATKPKILLDRG